MKINHAVVLAAGASSRFGKNKLEVKIHGKTLPQYIMDFCIANEIQNVYITISKSNFYIEDNKICHPIIQAMKGYYENFLNIKYQFQNQNEYGPGAALKCWKGIINQPFITLFGDNYYNGTLGDINLEENDCVFSYLYKKPSPRNLQLAAIVDNIIIQKPHQIVTGQYFCGYVAFNDIIFNTIENIRKSGRNEYEITDIINFCEKRKTKNNQLTWSDITYQGDIEKIQKIIGDNK